MFQILAAFLRLLQLGNYLQSRVCIAKEFRGVLLLQQLWCITDLFPKLKQHYKFHLPCGATCNCKAKTALQISITFALRIVMEELNDVSFTDNCVCSISCAKASHSYCNHALQIFFLRQIRITNFISHAEEICNAFILRVRIRYFCTGYSTWEDDSVWAPKLATCSTSRCWGGLVLVATTVACW